MISVCIATYNGEKYIKMQLESILSQISFKDEIIVSDDGSTDKTIHIIEKLRDKRIKIFRNNKEKGYTKNFENAIEKSKGDYIILSDQDDIWEKNKIDICMKYLQDGYDFVVSDAQIVNEKLDIVLEESFYKFRKSKEGFLGNIIKFSYLGCCMAFNKKVKEKIIPFPKNQKLCTHDNWIYLVSSLFFNIYHIDEKLIKYRRHSTNVSTGGNKKELKILFMIKYRIYILLKLILLKFK